MEAVIEGCVPLSWWVGRCRAGGLLFKESQQMKKVISVDFSPCLDIYLTLIYSHVSHIIQERTDMEHSFNTEEGVCVSL